MATALANYEQHVSLSLSLSLSESLSLSLSLSLYPSLHVENFINRSIQYHYRQTFILRAVKTNRRYRIMLPVLNSITEMDVHEWQRISHYRYRLFLECQAMSNTDTAQGLTQILSVLPKRDWRNYFVRRCL